MGELPASGVVTFAIDVDAEFAATAIGTVVRRVKSAEVVARTVGLQQATVVTCTAASFVWLAAMPSTVHVRVGWLGLAFLFLCEETKKRKSGLPNIRLAFKRSS